MKTSFLFSLLPYRRSNGSGPALEPQPCLSSFPWPYLELLGALLQSALSIPTCLLFLIYMFPWSGTQEGVV